MLDLFEGTSLSLINALGEEGKKEEDKAVRSQKEKKTTQANQRKKVTGESEL